MGTHIPIGKHVDKQEASKKRKQNTISMHVIDMALLILITMFLQEPITSIVIKTLLWGGSLFIYLTPLLWLNLMYTTFSFASTFNLNYLSKIGKKGGKNKVGVLIT